MKTQDGINDEDLEFPARPETAAAPAAPVLLACTVLVTGTQIGPLKTSKGHKCHLTEAQAKALASLNPPAVRIDGI